MFARSSTIEAQPAMIGAGVAHIRDTVMPAMTHLDGFVGLSLLVGRDTGRCIATSAWRTEQAMHASAARADGIRDAAAEAFGGDAVAEEWEVAVLHRAHHARAGTCMRVTWARMDPGKVDEALNTFKMGTIAQIEDLPGFCSASLMLNRTSGRAVVTVGYDDRDALDRSRDPGASVRAQAAREAELDVLEVEEFDLELAHLHVPETV